MNDDAATPVAPRPPRFRTTARILLAFVLLGVPLVAGSVAYDLLAVRDSLQQAQQALGEVRGSLGEVDAPAAVTAVDDARAQVDDAARRADRPTWTLMRFAPFVGPSIDVTRDVVEVAASAVAIADIAVTQGEALLADGLDVAVVDGRIDLQPLQDAHRLVVDLPVERLAVARDELARPREGWLPPEIRDGRADTLAVADETLEALQRAESLTAALPDLFGATEPRRYFLGFQTSAELRGTGGLVGFWGILGIDDGRVSFGQSEDLDPFDDLGAPEGEVRTSRIRSIGLSSENPPDADPAFVARYGVFAGARSFPNTNLEPDLPTAATAMLDLYEFQTDDRPDGVILLDPVALQSMLEATDGGSLPLPDEHADELGYPDGLPVEELVTFSTVDIYDTLGFERTDERREVLRALGDAAFVRVLAGDWDAPAMVRAVAEATATRNLQIHTTDEHVQDALSDIGATGQLTIPVGVDQFAVTANNTTGGKQDVHLAHAFAAHITLGEVQQGERGLYAPRDVSWTTVVDNPLPSSGLDLYIIGNCFVPGEQPRCFEGEPGANRTWFTLWSRTSDTLMDATTTDPAPAGPFTSTYRGMQAVDHFLFTPAQSQGRSELQLTGSAPIRQDTDGLIYEWRWHRQAKAIPDLLDVTIELPDGLTVDRVELTGGGTGQGMGVHGEGEQLTATVDGGRVHLQGTANADVYLDVHLRPQGGRDVEAAR